MAIEHRAHRADQLGVADAPAAGQSRRDAFENCAPFLDRQLGEGGLDEAGLCVAQPRQKCTDAIGLLRFSSLPTAKSRQRPSYRAPVGHKTRRSNLPPGDLGKPLI